MLSALGYRPMLLSIRPLLRLSVWHMGHTWVD